MFKPVLLFIRLFCKQFCTLYPEVNYLLAKFSATQTEVMQSALQNKGRSTFINSMKSVHLQLTVTYN